MKRAAKRGGVVIFSHGSTTNPADLAALFGPNHPPAVRTGGYKDDLLTARAVALDVAEKLGEIAYLADPDPADDAWAKGVLRDVRRAARFMDDREVPLRAARKRKP